MPVLLLSERRHGFSRVRHVPQEYKYFTVCMLAVGIVNSSQGVQAVRTALLSSVGDPHVFEPPGSGFGSVSQMYGTDPD